MPQPILRNLKVVGTFFRTPGEKAKLMTRVGHAEPIAVAFAPEPTNSHDEHAVGVMVQVGDEWVHGGYIPATVSALFAAWLNSEPAGLAASCDVGVAKGCPEITLTVTCEEGTAHHG